MEKRQMDSRDIVLKDIIWDRVLEVLEVLEVLVCYGI
jgi:hypothetical protein